MKSPKNINYEKLNNIKLLVIDVDGTLVRNDGTISDKTINLIRDLQKEDVYITLASGRLHSALIDIAITLKTDTPLISLDGALIKNYKGDRIVFQSTLRKKVVTKAIELSERYFINIALCHADAIYYTEHNSAIPAILDKLGALFKEVNSYSDYINGSLELVFAGDNRKTMEYLRDKLSFPFTFGTSVVFFRSHSHDNIYYLEIKKSGSTKAKGLKRLLNYLNLSETQSLVIGDWYNDIPLFKTKAFKVAMGNAVSELKNLSDIVLSETNDNDGITEILELLLNTKRKIK